MAKALTLNQAYQRCVLPKLQKIKTDLGCVICKYNKDPAGLLYHPISGTLLFPISDRSYHGPPELEAEIQKCIVICHTCRAVALHRKTDLSREHKVPKDIPDIMDGYVELCQTPRAEQTRFRGKAKPKDLGRSGVICPLEPEVNGSTQVLVDQDEDFDEEVDEIRSSG